MGASRARVELEADMIQHMKEVRARTDDADHPVSFRSRGENTKQTVESAKSTGESSQDESEVNYPSSQKCMKDDRNTPLDMAAFEWRNSILQWVQPWKYEKATIDAYKNPQISKIYYINGGDSE